MTNRNTEDGHIQTPSPGAQLAYWRRQLEGAPAVLNLPTDRPRQSAQSRHTGDAPIELSAAMCRALDLLSSQEGVTLFITLLTAFKTVLFHYTGQDDLVVAIPVANGERAEAQPAVGALINILPLRTNLSGDPTFRQLLQRRQ